MLSRHFHKNSVKSKFSLINYALRQYIDSTKYYFKWEWISIFSTLCHLSILLLQHQQKLIWSSSSSTNLVQDTFPWMNSTVKYQFFSYCSILGSWFSMQSKCPFYISKSIFYSGTLSNGINCKKVIQTWLTKKKC